MRVLLLFLTLFYSTGYCQKTNISAGYFEHPLEIPLSLSGTFGELRSNHFHSGLDLKTEGKEGFSVLASAAGEIVRIKVSHFGYGKALYIKHPNGYTTVYAHLQKFAPKIEAYVKKRQYAKESYEIQLYPKTGSLTVTQGELIALSGNTGGSGGPHLHFEIRDPQSRPLNPLNYGMKVADTKAPNVSGVWLYSKSEKAHVNNQQSLTQLRLIDQGNNTYKTEKVNAFGTIGIGVSTIDQQNLATNKNGVYAISSSINGSKIFELKMNRFSFNETRYINRLIDHAYYKKEKTRITKLFIEPNNPLTIYKKKDENGLISIEDGFAYQIKVEINDQPKNTTTIIIPIEGVKKEEIDTLSLQKTPYWVARGESFTHTLGDFDLYIPKNSLYESAYLDIKKNADTIQVHREETALHKKITLAFNVSKYSEEDQKKLYIGRLNYKGEPYYSKTIKKGTRVLTKTRTFGSYALFSDLEAPLIVPINVAEGKWMSKETLLKLKIHDEQTGIASYRATINGKFILAEYDYKTGMLVYDFNDKIIDQTENKLKLIVFDNVGNKTTFETTFFRKL